MNLTDIRKLIDEATPGPWISDRARVRFPCYKSPSGYDAADLEIDVCTGQCTPTASFIAAARTLMPKLLAVAEAAKTRNHLSECEYFKMDEAVKALDAALAALEADE